MTIHFFLMWPETAGKTLEEIDDLFAPGALPAWKTRVGHSRLDDEINELELGAEKHEIHHYEKNDADV
ncbi:hypothetical protein AWJ20_4421 [Sugiyamaella lignohabitans]|uniref:Uncharacterized protein n=1 Tax=Sugiyamaella lignohabitans TaxID=796027 RepID=A0A167CEX1_9ASCO|nr:uncharacterized protein AWJ20_4421 [Sugiyamaella lignohabitans]ANB11600.1 hypothetical protein AWJ20_4421 [Sugiyamaella lignohabitans]